MAQTILKLASDVNLLVYLSNYLEDACAIFLLVADKLGH